MEIEISGFGFQNGAAAQLFALDRRFARDLTNVQYLDSTHLKATFNPAGVALGEWDLFVINPDREAASLRTNVVPEPASATLAAAAIVVWVAGRRVLRRKPFPVVSLCSTIG